jgi:hypothetical protein
MSTAKYPRIQGFGLGIYVVKGAEIIDYDAPHGVFCVARRYDPELDALPVAIQRLKESDPGNSLASHIPNRPKCHILLQLRWNEVAR